MTTTYRTGSAFPGVVPQQEGATLEIDAGGMLNLLVQMPKPTPGEDAALRAGLLAYGIIVQPPLVLWLWKFSTPIGILDSPFDAWAQQSQRQASLEAFLDDTEGVKNGLLYFALDGRTLCTQRLLGLSMEAVSLFRKGITATIRDYSPSDFAPALQRAYGSPNSQLWTQAKIWTHQNR